MKSILLLVCAIVAVTVALPVKLRPEDTFEQQPDDGESENAHYAYSSNIADEISGLSQQRMEVRDGASVKGVYSYSDGYFRHTVEYVADKDGYRVVNESAERLDGPMIDLNGKASIETNAHGHKIKYVVQSVPEPVDTKKH